MALTLKSLELMSIVVARDQSPTNQSGKAVTMSDDTSRLFLKHLGVVKHYVYSMCFSSRVGIRLVFGVRFCICICLCHFKTLIETAAYASSID